MKEAKNMMTVLVGGGMALLALAGGAILGIAVIAKKAIVASLISLAISVVMGIKKFMSAKKNQMGPGPLGGPPDLEIHGMTGGDPFGSYHGHHYSHYKSS